MGEERHDGLAIPGRIVLAHEPPFAIGAVRVHPATRQIEWGGHRETLEPKIMEVLVALGRSDGRIVTRDELIAWCWGGRIVGEDAINRAISRIRQLGASLGGSFSVETITKVGYRLVAGPSGSASDRPAAVSLGRSGTSRRAVLAGGAVAAAAVAGGLVWFAPWRHRPNPEAVEMVRRGDLAQRAGTPDQTRQAVSFFERAVRLDPKYGAAWGALALSYTHSLDGFSEAQMESLPGRIRSAAARALELDPDNADAQLAVACTPPYFRNWLQMEPALRRVRNRFPDHWLANGRLAILYYQVGRWNEGVKLHLDVISGDPTIPGPYAFGARALSNAGRIQEADALLEEARERWPAHQLLWFTRYEHLLFTGRPASAAAMVMDPEARPSGLPQPLVDQLLQITRAVEYRRPDDVQAVIRQHRELAGGDVRSVQIASPIFALFGDVDLAFDAISRYFFNRGPFGTPAAIGPYTRRYTDFLFTAPMAAVRRDPRFAQVTEAIGLQAYWDATGTRPDYLS